jgi:hypothetical protein
MREAVGILPSTAHSNPKNGGERFSCRKFVEETGVSLNVNDGSTRKLAAAGQRAVFEFFTRERHSFDSEKKLERTSTRWTF